MRFHDWRSEYSVGSDKIVSEGRHTAFDSLKDKTLGAFSFLGNSSRPETLNKSTPEERKAKTRVLDPQGPFLQRWNKIFVISCLIAVSVDPLFFYIPVIDGVKNCLYLDKKIGNHCKYSALFHRHLLFASYNISVQNRICCSFQSIWSRCLG